MEMIDHAAAHDPVITQRVFREIGPMMKEVESNYGQLLTLPEDEANRLLTSGPNDSANRGAMARNLELWNEVQRPMPVLLKRMQDEVANGKIHGGLELELTKRISEFHLRQLGML